MEENIPASLATSGRSKKLVTVSIVSLMIIGAAVVFLAAFVVMPRLGQDDQAGMETLSGSDLSAGQAEPLFETSEGISPNWIKNNTESGTIDKGDVQWQAPQDLGNLDLADPENEYRPWVKYVKTGTVAKGDFAGGEMLLLAYYDEGPAYSPYAWKVLRFEGKYIFLGRYLNEFGGEYFNSYVEGLKRTLTGKASPMEFNTEIRVAEFEYPSVLQGSNSRQLLVRKSINDMFLPPDRLSPVFVHPQFGQVYLADSAKFPEEFQSVQFESNKFGGRPGDMTPFYADPVQRDYFYFKAPDGTAVAYEMKIDIIAGELVYDKSAILDVVWNSGAQNQELYEVKALGCGSSKAVYNFTGQVAVDRDLVEIGNARGTDKIYGFKDAGNKIFSDYYETYYVPEGQSKLGKEQFLKANPIVFWVDPFGRTLGFYKAEFISPAECGKPVIYLYPVSAGEVSVKVSPGHGLTVTEPAYGDGWKVWAEPNGQLTDLADGRQYPYLFWEGNGDVSYRMPKAGFVVDNYNLENFFDLRLNELGLNAQEAADFKEFWVPQMRAKHKPHYFITFLPKKFTDRLAPLEVKPRPDTVIRVMMDWAGLDAHKKVPVQSLEAPVRHGFTVVEWGGMLK